jgi:hypothetical protein
MAQSYSLLVSGTTVFGSLYGILNNNFETVRTNNSGTAEPSSPSLGWMFFNTEEDSMYVYTSDGWSDLSTVSDNVTDALADIDTAKGTLSTLAARLNVALNEDGTLRSDAPSAGWWEIIGTPTYISASQVSVEGEYDDIFNVDRAVQLIIDDVTYTDYVSASSYDSENDLTTITLLNETAASGVTAIYIGQDVDNSPFHIGSTNASDLGATSDEIIAGTEDGKFLTPASADEAQMLSGQKTQVITVAYNETWSQIDDTELDGLDLTSRGRFAVQMTADTTLPVFAPDYEGEWHFHIYNNGYTLSLDSGWDGLMIGEIDSDVLMHRIALINDGNNVILDIAQ